MFFEYPVIFFKMGKRMEIRDKKGRIVIKPEFIKNDISYYIDMEALMLCIVDTINNDNDKFVNYVNDINKKRKKLIDKINELNPRLNAEKKEIDMNEIAKKVDALIEINKKKGRPKRENVVKLAN